MHFLRAVCIVSTGLLLFGCARQEPLTSNSEESSIVTITPTAPPEPLASTGPVLAARPSALPPVAAPTVKDTSAPPGYPLARFVGEILRQAHLSRPTLDEKLSREAFRQFLRNMDSRKAFFLQSDIDEFKKQEANLARDLQRNDTRFASAVHARFVQRYYETLGIIEELLKNPVDFTVKETIQTKFDDLNWPKDEAERKDRWRKIIKYELLLNRLAKKPQPDEEFRQKLLIRYRDRYRFWQQMDYYELMELYLTALTSTIDPHTSYLSPNSLEDLFNQGLHLNLEGIGARLRTEDGATIVVDIVPGGSAAVDGRLQPNDKIIAVAQGDNQFVDIRDMKLSEAVRLIRGKAGTKVQLKVIPAGKLEPTVYELVRQKVEFKESEAKGEILTQGKKADGTPYRIGVISLPSFYGGQAAMREKGKSATEDIRRILEDFKERGVDGVILDLRDNGGGLLTEAAALTGLFIDRGPIVQVKGNGRIRAINDPEAGVVYDGPLMVLINRTSASASEILAGALKDYGRALIVGGTSFGKGTVQNVLEIGPQLDPNDPPKLGAVKLTIQQFYRVNGDSTQNRGVIPDLFLPSLADALEVGEKHLDHAIAFDQVPPVRYNRLDRVSPSVKERLRQLSTERIRKSPEFAKLIRERERLAERRARTTLPLHEEELKAFYGQDKPEDLDEKEEKKDKKPAPGTFDRFPLNYTNKEILQIMVDWLRGA